MPCSISTDGTRVVNYAQWRSAEAIEEIRRTAVKQLRMIVIGINGWHSNPWSPPQER